MVNKNEKYTYTFPEYSDKEDLKEEKANAEAGQQFEQARLSHQIDQWEL